MSTKKSVAHAMWAMLHDVGVRRVYGIPGDAMNGILVALRDFPDTGYASTGGSVLLSKCSV